MKDVMPKPYKMLPMLKLSDTNEKLRLFKMVSKSFTELMADAKDEIRSFKDSEIKEVQEFYLDFTGGKVKSLEMVSPLCSDEPIPEGYATWRKLNMEKNLKKMKELGLIPLKSLTKKRKGYDYMTCGRNGTAFRTSIILELMAQLGSYEECDKSTKDNYAKLQEGLITQDLKLSAKYPNHIETLKKWLEISEKEFGFYFGFKFWSYFINGGLDALRQGKVLMVGSWTTKDGKNMDYPLNDMTLAAVKLLQTKFSALYDVGCDILIDEGIRNYVESYYESLHRKQSSNYCPISLFRSRPKIHIGKNNIVINKLMHDKVNGKIVMEIKSPEDIENPKPYTLTCNYHKFTHDGRRKKGYFENLEIIPSETEKQVFDVSYAVNGKYTFKGKLRVPSFSLEIHNPKIDLKNPHPNDYDIVVYFPVEIVTAEKHSLISFQESRGGAQIKTFNPLIQLMYGNKKLSLPGLFTAFPTIRTNDQKQIKEKAVKLAAPLVVASVDLGFRPLVNMVVKSHSVNTLQDLAGKHTEIVIAELISETPNSAESFLSDCWNLRKKCQELRDVINEARCFVNGTPEKVKEQTYRDWLDNHTDIKPMDFKLQEHGWIGCELSRTIAKEIKQLVIRRARMDNGWEYAPIWMNTLNEYLRTMTSFEYFGMTYNKDEKPEQKERRKTRFQWVKTLRRNLIDDTVKKIVHYIVYKAYDNGASVIAMEKLYDVTGDKYQSAAKNSYHNLWARGQIADGVRNAAAAYGMIVVFVDETNTSQFHPVTGKIGYRPKIGNKYKHDHRKCYFENGEIMDANIMACHNIDGRLVSRHTNIASFKLVNIMDDLYVLAHVTKNNSEEKNPRLNGAISKRFGKDPLSIVFRKQEERFVVTGLDAKKIMRGFKRGDLSDVRYVLAYIHGNEIVSFDGKKQIVEKIQNIVYQSISFDLTSDIRRDEKKTVASHPTELVESV